MIHRYAERHYSIIGYSQWVSPRRVTIIKDEGINGDLDRINAITFSWMNLANVYIILAYYDSAVAHPSRPGKITKQKLDALFLDDVQIPFRVQLKLTGNLSGRMSLPAETETLTQYAAQNGLSRGVHQTLNLLNVEARQNPRLEIVIDG